MIPTELIGSLPRTPELFKAAVDAQNSDGKVPLGMLQMQQRAVRQVLQDLNKTGSTILTDGEQTKPSYLTYSIAGLRNVEPDGVVVQYVDGHGRRLPRLTHGPFSYARYSGDYVSYAKQFTEKPFKQSTISPSTIFLIYPKAGIQGYNPTEFLNDAIGQAELDIRSCFGHSCDFIQIDSPELAMAIRIDPSKELLQKFIAVDNLLLDRFTASERLKIGVHICIGCDQGSSFCHENEYCHLIPELFKLHVDKLYLPLQRFSNKDLILQTIRKHMNGWNKLYLGITDVRKSDQIVSTDEIVNRIKKIAKYLPFSHFGTTDDCGFASFADAKNVDRNFALSTIQTRVIGTSKFY